MDRYTADTYPLNVAILGSTGSIGTQALDIARNNPDKINVVALGAHSNVDLINKQVCEFGAKYVVMGDDEAALRLVEEGLSCEGKPVEVLAGKQGFFDLAAHPDVDIVINAVMGFAGLSVTLAALKAGKRLGLANKESLVAGGDLVMGLVGEEQLIPVDSEHSAIFQCLLGEEREAFSKIWLTASGGPFRTMSAADIEKVTVRDALAHPTWTMGAKITIDSSTLMNKGLEVIEAKHLFDVEYDQIQVVVHPQSCIHSMVEFTDGSVKAHLGVTDMRIPIQLAFSYPHRWGAPVPPVDFTRIGSLDFEAPDYERFPCLQLALDAGRSGGTMPAVLNAANEVAVARFLAEKCAFGDIPRAVAYAMEHHDVQALESVEQLELVDSSARAAASEFLDLRIF